MPEDIPSGSERPKTPDERLSYTISNDPIASAPKFDVKATVWLKIPREGSFQVSVVVAKTSEDPLRGCTIRTLEDRHRGYRSLSTFLDSDENFMTYRRFGYLHPRMLLRKQDELGKLEMELDKVNDLDIGLRRLMCRDLNETA